MNARRVADYVSLHNMLDQGLLSCHTSELLTALVVINPAVSDLIILLHV